MSQWPNVIAAASGLLGATIGVITTLLGERWRARTTVLQERRQADARLRDERKSALLRFLAAIREVELLAEKRHDGGELNEAELRDRTSNLWLCKFEIDILCTQPVREAVADFTHVITGAAREPSPVPTHRYFADARIAFLVAAHGELDITPSLTM
jgi:hypothetical protein